jgi:7,8-dihydropterin-6-yl-methyl-4-(beta-D-ribofuranosyl)aminobenzene 5'-phosphate synthase
MMKKTEHTDEEKEQIRNTAFELMKTETVYYTGHCTGEPAFELMKKIMGDKLIHIGAGMRFEI